MKKPDRALPERSKKKSAKAMTKQQMKSARGGATAIEYGLIAATVAATVIVGNTKERK